MKVYELRNILLEYSPDADVLVYVPETKTLDEIKSHNPNGRHCVQLNLSEDGLDPFTGEAIDTEQDKGPMFTIDFHAKGDQINPLYSAVFDEDVFDVTIGDDMRTITAEEVAAGVPGPLADLAGYEDLSDFIWEGLDGYENEGPTQ